MNGLTLQQIAAALGGDVCGDQVLAPGPGHTPKDRSMSVKIDPNAPDGFVVNSFSGNGWAECKDYVRQKVGVPEWDNHPRPDYDPLAAMKARVNGGIDLNGAGPQYEPEQNGAEQTASRVVAEYIYQQKDGTPYLKVLRLEPKGFRQKHWTGSAWKGGKPEGDPIPYRLPEMLKAVHNKVFVVEGEKDADRLASLGFVATTAPEGAGKWKPALNKWFEWTTVFVLADNDEAGRKHALDVARNLHGIASDVRIVRLPGLPEKGDVSDWLDAGGDHNELIELCEGFPRWEPEDGEEPSEDGEEQTASENGEEQSGATREDERNPSWSQPIDLWAKFDPPELPRGVLPKAIEDFAFNLGEAMGADPAGLAMAALVVCAAAIPDCVQVQVKHHSPRWRESARLWVALLGPPSTKKSPIITEAAAPIMRIDADMRRAWAAAQAEYEELSKEEKRAKKPPKKEFLRITDTTIEKAQDILADSPQGVLCLRDELSGFFGAMDKYTDKRGSQAERASWLQAFNGGEYTVDRVSRGSYLIPNLSISLLSGIQPEPLRAVCESAVDDGLMQRLFIVMLQPGTLGKDEPQSDAAKHYVDIVERLRGRSKLFGGSAAAPTLVQFSVAAQAVRRQLEQRHLELMRCESINKKLAAHIGKYDGLFARLCLTFHCIEHAFGGRTDDISEDTTIPSVPMMVRHRSP